MFSRLQCIQLHQIHRQMQLRRRL